jgi:hypothetical protein
VARTKERKLDHSFLGEISQKKSSMRKRKEVVLPKVASIQKKIKKSKNQTPHYALFQRQVPCSE